MTRQYFTRGDDEGRAMRSLRSRRSAAATRLSRKCVSRLRPAATIARKEG